MTVEPEFGRRLRTRREERGLSQAELGARAGVHRNQVGRFERGEQEPRLYALLKLAKALNIDAGDLIRGLPPPHSEAGN